LWKGQASEQSCSHGLKQSNLLPLSESRRDLRRVRFSGNCSKTAGVEAAARRAGGDLADAPVPCGRPGKSQNGTRANRPLQVTSSAARLRMTGASQKELTARGLRSQPCDRRSCAIGLTVAPHEPSSYSTPRGGGCFRRRFFCPADGAAAEPAPVVVELFTSQGCSSCPPADRLLGELAGHPDVLPLSFHVTYWDRLGWPDTFGLEDSTRRQQLYADWLGQPRVYTPQMVIGGRIEVVGSSRGRVIEAIDLLQGHGEPGPELTVTGDRLSVAAGDQGAAAIWLVAFDDHQDVAIERGENRGKTLR
jgi:Protein of unknown function (DUF1223)